MCGVYARLSVSHVHRMWLWAATLWRCRYLSVFCTSVLCLLYIDGLWSEKKERNRFYGPKHP